jgi:hypothetical protein
LSTEKNKENIEKVKDLKNMWDYLKKYNLHRRKWNENSKKSNQIGEDKNM